MKYRISILILLIAFSACDKRYEDGPCVSFVKAENRLSGEWILKKVLREEQDFVTSSQQHSLETYRFRIFRNLEGAFFFQLADSTGIVLAENLVRTDDRMTELTFQPGIIAGFESEMDDVLEGIPPFQVERTWRICRLKKEELWISTEYESAGFELHFILGTDYPNL